MNKQTFLAAVVTLSIPFSAQAEEALTGCAAKRQNIEQQIRQAETHENSYRVEGLKKAYAEVVATCTDASLRKEREADVRKKQQKVSEREQELQQANASGRPDKIAKKRAKLEEARAELLAAEAELTK
ncbi:DUF1090 domain-containing protein [Enterobacter asburiae]